jgi:AcrR family transcriptional regulator
MGRQPPRHLAFQEPTVVSTKALRPRKTAVQARSRFTVDAICQAAVQVFSDRGYDGATTDLIAERAGVSVGTLYQYFPNKQAILIEIWNHLMKAADTARAHFAEQCPRKGRTGEEIMRWMVEGVYLLHKKTIKPGLFFEEVPQPDFIRERLLEKENAILGIFAEQLGRCPGMRKQNLQLASRVTYEVLERLIHRYLTHFTHEVSEAQFLSETTDILHRYLFTSGA